MKPLTIDELKSLEGGDWVWVITPTNNGEYYEKGFASDNEAFVGYSLHYQVEVLYSDYGTKWLAYKNKEQAESNGEIVELPCLIEIPYKVFRQDFKNYHLLHLNDEGILITDVFAEQDKAEAERRLAGLKGE